MLSKLKEYRERGMDEHSLLIHTIKMQRESRQQDTEVRMGRRHGIIRRK